MTRPSSSRVIVFLDGAAIVVPTRVDCHYAARGALGIARGLAVAYESAPDEPLTFERDHEFVDGDRYVTVDALSAIRALGFEVVDERRDPWQADPEAWKDGTEISASLD